MHGTWAWHVGIVVSHQHAWVGCRSMDTWHGVGVDVSMDDAWHGVGMACVGMVMGWVGCRAWTLDMHGVGVDVIMDMDAQ